MHVVNQYEKEIDGNTYVVTEYSNGTIEECIKSREIEPSTPTPNPNPLPTWEEAIYETQANTEYVACLMELQTM